MSHRHAPTCEEVQDWIWGTRMDGSPTPGPIHAHLESCAVCREEWSARSILGVELRGLRSEFAEAPSRVLDHRVVDMAAGAVATRESGVYPALRLAPASPAGPVATPAWMTAAAALLGAALLLGFSAGRFSASSVPGFGGGPSVHTTLATAASWNNMHRPHQVGISPDGLSRLQDGRTYLMTGPVGGPYEVVGAVSFDEVDLPSVLPRGELKEIVVAVGPSEGWQPGRELAVADLSASGAEILGRRRLEDPPVKVGFTAP